MTYGDVTSQGDLKSRLGGAAGATTYFNPKAFCAPPTVAFGTGTGYGDTGAGIVLGPGQFNFDAALLKNTQITERTTLQFRAEAFNLFNHAQFNNPNFGIPSLPTVTSTNFGWITSTSVNPRVLQLGLKFIF